MQINLPQIPKWVYSTTGNDMQFHHLHDLNEWYQLKVSPSSHLYRTVNKSNDMQFHHLNDLNEPYQLKGPPSSPLKWTLSLHNDMQFHQLNDSYELTKTLPHNSSQIQSNEIQFHQLHQSDESYELTRTLP